MIQTPLAYTYFFLYLMIGGPRISHVTFVLSENVGVRPAFHAAGDINVSTSTSTSMHSDDGRDNSYVIAGYWPDYRSNIDVQKSTAYMTDLILFSIEPREDGIISIRRNSKNNQDLGDDDNEDDTRMSCCLGDDIFDKAQAAKNMKRKDINTRTRTSTLTKSVNIWVSVGGAGRSRAFATVAKNETTRRKFVHQLEKLCQDENLKGIDFDWEQPMNREEYISYMQLIVDASIVLHKDGRFVSVALHPGQTLPKQVYDYIDRIHLMTYDMIELIEEQQQQPINNKKEKKGSRRQYYGYHASLDNTVHAVKTLVDSGCDSKKIIIGLPAYSRHEEDPSQVKTYSELVDEFLSSVVEEQVRGDDHESPAPSEIIMTMGEERIHTLESFKGYQLESRSLVKRKIQSLVMERNLGGIFIWEIGQDYRNNHSFDLFPGGLLLHHSVNAFFAGGDSDAGNHSFITSTSTSTSACVDTSTGTDSFKDKHRFKL